MGFVFADLLHNAEEVYGGEEVAPGEFGYGFGWEVAGWVAELVYFWVLTFAGDLSILE